jgi:S-adenosylmethionine hydrolase
MINPQPVITLLTDFGSQDYFAAAMKGVILSINPAAQIVDITHELPPQDIHAAAFNLLATYKDFPANTIHIVVVDPDVGSTRRAVLIECAGQFFVGPDNGIFSWVCEREVNYRAIHLTNENFFRHPVSTTFHGRDIFAPVAAALSNGVAPEEFGPAIERLVHLDSLKPEIISDGAIEASIIYIDRFGNCITNLTREILGDDLSQAKLVVSGREISSFRRYYREAEEREVFCVIGSVGFLEIVAANRSAAAILDARRGQTVSLVSRPNGK